MLDLANKYKSEINNLLSSVILNPNEYKYHYQAGFVENYEPKADTWHYLHFVSINEDNTLNGIIFANLSRTVNSVDSLTILSNKKSNIFMYDVLRVIDMLFNKYNFNKIKFNVTKGNKAEKIYDKFIEKYNGRIIGTSIKDALILTGEVCDVKYYELFKEDYNRSKSEKQNKNN